MSDGKATKSHFPPVKIDMLVTPQPGFVLTWLKPHQPFILFLPRCLLIYAGLYKDKRRAKCMRYLIMVIIFVVFVIRLTGYTNGIVRVYMNEKDPLRPRYEVPPGDVVLENTLHTKK